MKRVLLVTGHYYDSKRKAGFHWIADALWRQGWHVTFFTASLSYLSYLSHDYRFGYPVVSEAKKIKRIRERLVSYVWFTLFHPANVRFTLGNYLLWPLFRTYGYLPIGPGIELVESADVIIFESFPGLLLFPRFKKINARARFVYRVSDDLRYMKNHPIVQTLEYSLVQSFDLVSVPSQAIYDKFRKYSNINLKLHYHGVEKRLFDRAYNNPYPRNRVNAVFVGNSHFDTDFLKIASEVLPTWLFHIIGPLQDIPLRDNIIAYGEMPFVETIPYIKYADVGLQTRTGGPGAEALTDSLKVQQYTYCRLPIVAPEFLCSERINVFCYKSPVDESSIYRACLQALHFDRRQIDKRSVPSWEDLATALVEG